MPEDAIYCPHCTGDRKTTDRDVIRGGVRGGLLGLLVGLLPALVLLYLFGAERGIKAIALIVPIAFVPRSYPQWAQAIRMTNIAT